MYNLGYFGGFLAHVLTVVPWVLGAVFFGSIFPLFRSGHSIMGTILSAIFIRQYLFPLKPWPAFSKFLMDLNPRAYFRKCILASPVSNLKKQKVLGPILILKILSALSPSFHSDTLVLPSPWGALRWVFLEWCSLA